MSSVERAPRSESLRSLRIQVTTLGDLLLGAADRYPDSPALILPGERMTYGELAERALRRARSLQALGVKPREHVGILLPTCMEFVELLFAISLCGAVAVPMNARYRHNELAYVIENGDLVAVFTTDRIAEQVNFVERLHRALPELSAAKDPRRLALAAAPRLRHLVLLGEGRPQGFLGRDELEALAQDSSEDQVHESRLCVRLRDIALMLYTSGTTSNPKGCLISHEAMVRNSIALGRHRYALRHEDVFWSPLPIFHIAAILPLCAIFDVGGVYATMTYFEAGAALRMLESERVTATYPCFVTIMSDLIHHADFAKTDLSRIRLMNSNFAVQPRAIADAMLKAIPDAVYVGTFGMTETAGTVTTSRLDDPLQERITRLGRPLPGLELRILDPATGDDAPEGVPGEVLVRGYSTLEGYYKDAQKTAQALDPQGWFHTGDIGSLDAAGTVMFHGRLKDMLKVGGENVAAAEIETCLQRHPAVKLAQVVGVPHPRLVEVPAAFIERQADVVITPEELIEFCRREIAGFKVPRHVRFVTEWPMSTSKIQKFRLRDQLLAELGLSGA
ncbi:MAG TPA: AMP-binding protein [Steroidobacteraceae bacterium]|jgi:fatty-acyl-CoA synthase/long-chain acyl-CoA synthetase|nr:AMP-binding protein [Steroidobacteraceae bacterium]